MKKALVISLLAVLPLLSSPLVGIAAGDDPASPSPARKQYREQRPDDSRGWMILPKRSYWPLCYESLDRLQDTYQSIGKDDPSEVAEKLEKCASWLQLAAAAAMTDEGSGIDDTIDYCDRAAQSLRQNPDAYSDADLKELVVLGELSMAVSHVRRAALIDDGEKLSIVSSSKPANSKNSKLVNESEVEIRAERRLLEQAQYRYDAIETQRHLEVAISYLNAAQKLGKFSVDPAVLAEFEAIEAMQSATELSGYVSTDLRNRIKSLKSAINPIQADYRKRLDQLFATSE